MIRLWILRSQTLQGGIFPALFYSCVCRAHGIWDLAGRWETLGAPTGQGVVSPGVSEPRGFCANLKRSQLSFSEPGLGLPSSFPIPS